MGFSTIFFDLDDTLYPRSSGLWPAIANRIDLFIHTRLNIPLQDVSPLRKSLFSKYGTTMRGLVATYQIDTEDYLQFVHDIPVSEFISPNPGIRDVITSLPGKKVIFTNADTNHARRVLNVLEIEDCFEQIIDIVAISPYCKPQKEAFEIALQKVSEPSGSSCVLIDDSISNLATAKSLGFHTILIGNSTNSLDDRVDGFVTDIMEIANKNLA